MRLSKTRTLLKGALPGWAGTRATCLWSLAVFGAGPLSPLLSAAENPAWLTGKAVGQQLGQQLGVSWSRFPLRRALKHLAHNQHVAVVLDRRVDPSQSLELTVTEPLEMVLEKIAVQTRLGWTLLGSLIYFGPQESAAQLRTLAALRHEDLRKLPTSKRRALAEPRAWQWPELSAPRELVEGLGREAGIRVDGLERIEHDLWPAADLPPLPWVDRLTLVAIQFGLTFEVALDGRSVTLITIPKEIAIERSYPAGKAGAAVAEKWARLCPRAKIEIVGDKLRVVARLEDHETLSGHNSASRPVRTTPATGSKQVYELTIERPVGQLLEQLGERLGLVFQIDKAAIKRAGISLDQVVKVKVKGVSLDELLDAAVAPAGLMAKRTDRVVQVRPATPDK